MFTEFLQSSSILDLPVLAMLFFIGVFAAVLARALSKRRSADYARMARLPLDSDPAPGGAEDSR